ncbi:MAG: division/cell wall cluster transcriptional repressor MraZ [Flavobacteriales bacterium]|mgnify:CR=1 FL=1|jgi:MraZ protein|nr:MAG: division/cell wall cluster transcriptional repressor MraZ [Flavobacteriales bacterium]
MLDLLGEYPSTLDAKSRALLPAALKKQLGGEVAKGFVVNRDVFSQCLVLYPMEEWRRTSADVRSLNRFDPDNVEFLRRFLNGATPVELDANGRLLIPKPLMDYAKLGKDIVFSGIGDRIEIWDEELHRRALDGKEDFKSLAARVMGGKPKANDA